MNKDYIFKFAKRKKIKDRGIHWQEAYREKSLELKKRFDKTIGLHAYVRWEGHDYTTDSNYYVIVGPSVQDDKKMFFAGIKKLPKDPHKKIYSPYGHYFTTILGAMSYVTDHWGVQFPKGQPPYTQQHLQGVNIPEHIKGSIDDNYTYG